MILTEKAPVNAFVSIVQLAFFHALDVVLKIMNFGFDVLK